MSGRYAARQVTRDGVPVAELADKDADLMVSIAPGHGNIVFELLHAGRNWVYSPYASPAQMQGKQDLFGIPLLAPWANRFSSDTYVVNGREYTLNRKLGNLRLDKNHLAIHGFLTFTAWTQTEVHADANGADACSVLDFTRRPEWMAQFPFAHRLEWRHRLANGRLSIRLSITNESAEAMPLMVGFHPYFAIPGSGRDDWKIDLPVRTHMPVSDALIPTGERQPAGFDGLAELKSLSLDDVYTDLERDTAGNAIFRLTDARHSVHVGFDTEFTVAVIYAPVERNFICFEPMTAPTDAIHLAAEGRYSDLRTIAPGTAWTGEFWVEVS
ncbi:MAG TPA: aldose 1-epimerase [Bryobacteraceae bacterium]|nr:aldose 1-epimerase [Bryobacteraceae bacterium]